MSNDGKKSDELFELIFAGPAAVALMTLGGTIGEWLGFVVILLLAFHEAKSKTLIAVVSWIVSAVAWDALLYNIAPQYGHVIFWFLK